MSIQITGAKPATAPISGLYSNLKVIKASAATVTVTADEVILKDSSGNSIRHSSVSVTPNITSSGANGLDTGAEAANTIYRIWLISNGTTVAGLLSTSSTAPTMPSGYTYKALISSVGNDNSSNFINFIDQGNIYRFVVWPTMASGNVTSGSWTSIDLTPANMTTNAGFVDPALSDHAFGTFSGTAGNSVEVGNDNTIATGGTDAPNKHGYATEAAGDIQAWDLHIITADTIYWNSNDAGCKVRLQGFFKNKLT